MVTSFKASKLVVIHNMQLLISITIVTVRSDNIVAALQFYSGTSLKGHSEIRTPLY